MGFRHLLTKAREGNGLAFTKLCEIKMNKLRRIAPSRLGATTRAGGDADDVMQLTWQQVWKDFEQFQGSTRRELDAWLERIFTNVVNGWHRGQFAEKRDARRNEPLAAGEGSSVPGVLPVADLTTPSQAAMRNENGQIIHEAMAELPSEDRRAVQAIHIDGLTSEEHARREGKSPGRIRHIKSRALRALAGILAKTFGSPPPDGSKS